MVNVFRGKSSIYPILKIVFSLITLGNDKRIAPKKARILAAIAEVRANFDRNDLLL
jgi:hypothetical protein